MASGSQLNSGICADFPAAANSSASTAMVSVRLLMWAVIFE